MIRSGTRVSLASALLATVLALVSATPASAQGKAKLTCKITENGESATGTVVLMAGDAEVARGSCAKGVTAPAGSYEAVLRLDGALDGPEQRKPVELAAGGSQSVQADFSTGLLEVKIQREGRRAAGMAIIRKGGKQIGTLGSGVAAHLSVGTYEVVARYRTQEKRFEAVTISRGQRVTLDAAFE